MYLEGWVCLQPTCEKFWRADCKAFETLCVNYRPEFLSLRYAVSVPPGLAELRPYRPEQYQRAKARLGPSIRGWWCERCGQVCSRWVNDYHIRARVWQWLQWKMGVMGVHKLQCECTRTHIHCYSYLHSLRIQKLTQAWATVVYWVQKIFGLKIQNSLRVISSWARVLVK